MIATSRVVKIISLVWAEQCNLVAGLSNSVTNNHLLRKCLTPQN